ncbi:hypothetical protein M409DRAFT_50896 [Zasmidium cellare ATCC 36951]|uniref:Uncharacterized protein n=1 Tax=Zasmidium cellare ATCC 36951 TaxID=1080233 RepID=A0A6A6CZ40_ZASCE|nr:uncharacterized protein M409DRAFT_50896 [Zasmidium cellare ATCC 36951]KAF2171460.1 hypothetical protein M409DRAFT_50896 [Zasmidium cellare ATCC 36951]
MMFTTLLPIALIGLVSASPVPAGDIVSLEKRQSATTCGSTSYSQLAVQQSYGAGADHTMKRTVVRSGGGSNYPHVFNNKEQLSFPACSGLTLYEFPLEPENQVFTTGDAAGADRVVYATTGPNQFTYCGAMTHTGAPTRSGFVLCS